MRGPTGISWASLTPSSLPAGLAPPRGNDAAGLPWRRPLLVRRGPVRGSVALSLCTTDHQLYARFTNIFDGSISETTMRPNPRSGSTPPALRTFWSPPPLAGCAGRCPNSGCGTQRRKVKSTGLTRSLGRLQASNRDFQSKYWADLQRLGRPCGLFSRAGSSAVAILLAIPAVGGEGEDAAGHEGAGPVPSPA
jgi:hypothetical protein